MGQPVLEWQIITTNPDRLAQFYTALFDWTIDADNALNYRRVKTGAGRGIDGGFGRPRPRPPDSCSFSWLS